VVSLAEYAQAAAPRVWAGRQPFWESIVRVLGGLRLGPGDRQVTTARPGGPLL
jgi:hypothetical protein